MIASDVLAMMGVLNNELDASAGGTDESRSLTALNMAIDLFEGVASTFPRILSRAGDNPIKTVALKESSPMPSDLLRIDRMWALDTASLLPIWPLTPIQETGGHAPATSWLLNLLLSSGSGQPREYYADSTQIYWAPKPDAIYSIRAYGLWATPTIADRKSALLFPDSVGLPIAAFAVKYLLTGVDDAIDTIQAIATESFTPVLRALKKRDRSIAKSRVYGSVHVT